MFLVSESVRFLECEKNTREELFVRGLYPIQSPGCLPLKGLHHWLLIGTGGYSTPPKDLMQVCGTSILVVGISVLLQASQREGKSVGTTNYNLLWIDIGSLQLSKLPRTMPSVFTAKMPVQILIFAQLKNHCTLLVYSIQQKNIFFQFYVVLYFFQFYGILLLFLYFLCAPYYFFGEKFLKRPGSRGCNAIPNATQTPRLHKGGSWQMQASFAPCYGLKQAGGEGPHPPPQVMLELP